MENFLTVKEAVNKYIDGCDAKVNMAGGKLMIKAVFAGIMIAMGAAGSSVAAHSIGNVGAARLAAAVVFPVGLMMVLLLGAELFTGDCLMVMGTLERRHKAAALCKTLVMVYIGNFIGAALLAFGIMASGQLDYSGGLLGAYTIKIALGKTGLSFGKAVVSGTLCNILVCGAVLMAGCARDITGKLLSSFFVILLFVTAGFEHCVANMYYITAGLLAKTNPVYLQAAITEYGYSAEQLSTLNLYGFLVKNLLPVTLGNIIGGMLFIGIPMLYLNREEKKEEKKEESEAKNKNEYRFIFKRGITGAEH